MNTYTCRKCGEGREYKPLMLEGRECFKPQLCPTCSELEQRALETEAAEKARARVRAEWDAICPAAYRQTDPNFPLMNHKLLEGLMRFDPSRGIGIGLHGPTGMRKTRMLCLVLKKLHFSGVRVFYVSAKRLSGCYSIMFGKDSDAGEARDVIRKSLRAEVLLLDDIGKERFTDRGQAEFYDLVESRTSRLKPILWTANASGDELAAMMSADRGGPIVRRLEDFAEVIGVGLEDEQ